MESHSSTGGHAVDVRVLVEWVRALWFANAVSGLTLSGGEPMEQAAELDAFLDAMHGCVPALSIGLFSGCAETELVQGRFHANSSLSGTERAALWQRIRGHLDFAVLGRYNQRQPSRQPLVTSRNQRLVLVSDRYTADDFTAQCVEITIGAEGLTQVTGFPVLQ